MNLLLVLQEYVYSINSKKQIDLLRQYVNPKSSDVLLGIGGNTGKISAAYSRIVAKTFLYWSQKTKM